MSWSGSEIIPAKSPFKGSDVFLMRHGEGQFIQTFQQAALGESAQAAAQRDINALFNIGGLEQAQRQSEYDVQRAAAIGTSPR